MAVGDYRARIVSSEAAANGDVHLDTYVERQTVEDPETWETVPGGHRTAVLDGAAVIAIVENGGLTLAQKRSQLSALFKSEIDSWNLEQSDRAHRGIQDVVPGFPLNIGLPQV